MVLVGVNTGRQARARGLDSRAHLGALFRLRFLPSMFVGLWAERDHRGGAGYAPDNLGLGGEAASAGPLRRLRHAREAASNDAAHYV